MSAAVDVGARRAIQRLEATLEELGARTRPDVLRGHRLARVVQLVAEEWGVCRDALAGENRAQRVVRPRQAVMLIAAQHCGWSTPRIGRALRRDHSTVIYGIRAAEARAAEDPDYARRIGRVVERIETERATPA